MTAWECDVFIRRPSIIFIVSWIKSVEKDFKRQHLDNDFPLRLLDIKTVWSDFWSERRAVTKEAYTVLVYCHSICHILWTQNKIQYCVSQKTLCFCAHAAIKPHSRICEPLELKQFVMGYLTLTKMTHHRHKNSEKKQTFTLVCLESYL